MSLLALIKPNGPSGFGYGSTAEDVTAGLSLQGKTILITGCNSGLGYETLRVLAMRGAHVVGTARTPDKAEAACRSVTGTTTGLACELTEPASVRGCVAAVAAIRSPLDAIICNAGIMALPKLEQVAGCERQIFTNHIGHFILVTGLLDHLTADGRVVMVSSEAHRNAPEGGIAFDNLSGARGYQPWRAYGQSKFANLLFAKHLARRLAGTGRTANAVHPGVILSTNLMRNMNLPWPIAPLGFGLADFLAFKTIAQGAATQCYTAVHPKAAGTTGAYLSDCNTAKPRPDAENAATAERLWQVSEKIAAAA